MSLRVCLDCTTAFAVGVPRCPHCGSERHAEQGSAAALGVHASTSFEENTMPKITRHGGPSDRNELRGEHGPEVGALAEGARVYPVDEGSEQPSAGSSSETSFEKPSTTPETNAPATRKRARKTASRSDKAQTVSPTAPSTAGGQADAESATDAAADEGGAA